MLDDLHLSDVSEELVKEQIGKDSEHLICSVLAHVLAGVASNPVSADKKKFPLAAKEAGNEAVTALCAQAWTRYQHHYALNNGRFAQVYPDVVLGLQAMQAIGWPLVCVTNKPVEFAAALLQAKSLDGYFQQVFGYDSFARKKLDALPLLEACKTLGVCPAQMLMLGDSSNDAIAARAAVCPVLLVTYGYNHGVSVHTALADGYCDSLADLQDLIAGLSVARP